MLTLDSSSSLAVQKEDREGRIILSQNELILTFIEPRGQGSAGTFRRNRKASADFNGGHRDPLPFPGRSRRLQQRPRFSHSKNCRELSRCIRPQRRRASTGSRLGPRLPLGGTIFDYMDCLMRTVE